MSRYEYPRLSRRDILSYLEESQIVTDISEHDLADPKPDVVCNLYTQLLIHLDSFNEEDGKMEFAALQHLENPDLHVDSVRRISLHTRVKEVIASLNCPKKFTFRDLNRPDAERTEIFVSAILNFCFHRDSKMNLLTPIMEEINLLDEKQREWKIKISQLNAEMDEIKEARERELPFVQEVDAELKELHQTIAELNNQQVSLRTTNRKLKGEDAEMNAKIASAEFGLVQSVQENRDLRSKIVQSPDKLQSALDEKKLAREEAKNAEKLVKQSFDDKNGMIDLYTKAFEKMSKHLAQMQKLQDQVNSAKATEKDVKALKNKLSDEGVLDKSLEAKLVELQQSEEQLGELKKLTERESHMRCEEATRELNAVKMEMVSTKHELEARQRKIEQVVGEVDSITTSSNLVKESSAAQRQELLHKCEDIVKEFHQYTCSISSILPMLEEQMS